MTRLRWSAFGLAVYVLFLLVGPFLHHDLACELKTPQHCTVCTSTVLSADPAPLAAPGAAALADAGGAVTESVLVDELLLAVRTTGRSPPSAAR